MEQMEKYYRVYADFKQSLEKIGSHHYITAAQELADNGEDTHIGKVYYRVVDLDWVEAIESTLVYIDKAIREQRRFIEVTEEVVPIEKARNITTESVRHLAQHTNLIARVEGEDVTPERILNIQREESFAIYENRFLYTLLQKLAYFVGLRYKALSDAPNDSFSKVNLHRDFQVFDEKIEYDLSFSIESHTNTKVDLNADVTTLSGYERVLRIRTVLGDFLSTPLMRELTGCELVRPPILHTNLMTKNPNFKKSLDLWNYIETYTKPGYQAAGNEFDGVLEDKYKKALYDTVALQQFAIELCSNPDLEEQLQADYEEEKRAAEEERKRAEEERIRIYEQKAELAVLEERDALRKQIEGFEKNIGSLEKNIATLTVDSENKDRKIERLTSENKHLEKELNDKITKIGNMQLELDRKESELQAAREETEKFKAKFEEQTALNEELTAKVASLETTISELEAAIAAHIASIAALEADIEAKKAEIEQKASAIASLEADVTSLKGDIENHKAQIASMAENISSLEANVASLNEEVSQKSELIDNQQTDINAKAEQISALESDVAQKAGTIENLNNQVSQQQDQIAQNNEKMQADAAELLARAEAINALKDTVEQGKNTIAEREATIAAKDNEISARDASIASLNKDIENNNAAHNAATEQLKADLAKQQEKAVAAARKEELAAFKKQRAGINSAAKAMVAAATLAAEGKAKAKVLAAKNVRTLDNDLSTDEYRQLIKTACAINKAFEGSGTAVLVDDYDADTKALAEKYGVDVIAVSALSKSKKGEAAVEILNKFKPYLEQGDKIHFVASSEKETGLVSLAELAAREAEFTLNSTDSEAVTGSALPTAVAIKQAAEKGAEISANNIQSVTFANSQLGQVVGGRFKKICKTDEINLPLALEDVFTDCDKSFAFVLQNGMSDEEAAAFAEMLKSENSFESVFVETTSSVKLKSVAAKSATVYFYNK